ncbi:MAG: HpcH/HpaI aldolase family protein [Gammaproteobacteria bacterium]
MKRNKLSFAERLRRGELLIGTLVSLPSPEVAEILAGCGFDWLFIDAEHGAFNPQQAQRLLQAAGDCPCVVRVPSGDEVWIKKALDTGAAGVIVPQVHTADQARRIVKYCKYSPAGSRGVGTGRAHKYGLEFEQYIKRANQQTAVILQAESKEAVENIAEIAAVKGVDAIFIGPYDLSASLGRIGQVQDRKVTAAIDRIVRVCKAAGVRLGFFGVSNEAVRPRIKQGLTLITVGVDCLFLTKSAQATLAELRA